MKKRKEKWHKRYLFPIFFLQTRQVFSSVMTHFTCWWKIRSSWTYTEEEDENKVYIIVHQTWDNFLFEICLKCFQTKKKDFNLNFRKLQENRNKLTNTYSSKQFVFLSSSNLPGGTPLAGDSSAPGQSVSSGHSPPTHSRGTHGSPWSEYLLEAGLSPNNHQREHNDLLQFVLYMSGAYGILHVPVY